MASIELSQNRVTRLVSNHPHLILVKLKSSSFPMAEVQSMPSRRLLYPGNQMKEIKEAFGALHLRLWPESRTSAVWRVYGPPKEGCLRRLDDRIAKKGGSHERAEVW